MNVLFSYLSRIWIYMNFFGSKDIKTYVKDYLEKNQQVFEGKIVIDIPAGSGFSSEILKKLNAVVEPYDLFPGFFKVEGLECCKADVTKGLPVEDQHADFVLCQEGIEHFPDQVKVFREFNRVLKKHGRLVLTTPNYSNIKSRLSYFLSESEYFYKLMPPNELDSVWFSDTKNQEEIYFGHVFLLGIQKLRVLAKLSGFRIRRIIPVRINKTSLYLFPLAYPAIWLTNYLAYKRALKKQNQAKADHKKSVYQEIYKFSIKPQLLLDAHLFVELEKETEAKDIGKALHNKYKDCDIVT